MGSQRAGKLEPSEEGQVRLVVGGSPPCVPLCGGPSHSSHTWLLSSIQSEHAVRGKWRPSNGRIQSQDEQN